MKFEDLVKKREHELIIKNMEDLRKNIDNSDYTFKINNYCAKFHFNPSDIKKQIMVNDVIASFFIKEPAKQNFTEKLVEEILNSKVLPQQGKNCIRFTADGEICSKRTSETTKSVDFCINGVYITQKYTRGTGGAQDNQYNDVVDFLTKGSQKYKVAAIVDGEYWDKRRKELVLYFKENLNVKIYSMDDIIDGGITIE